MIYYGAHSNVKEYLDAASQLYSLKTNFDPDAGIEVSKIIVEIAKMLQSESHHYEDTQNQH
ncbi:MAG: hypothetical protein KCHDKBKB_00730 [Elusimicrobia bacterium]|nr:hypothetical protein [Elusimicrobiota bacterium]